MEELIIKEKVKEIITELVREQNEKNLIPIEASGRHVHLSQKDLEELFGANYKLTQEHNLSQPGQYLAQEKVRLIGPKGTFDNVAILGPIRSKTQVEISKTDAIKLGVSPPVRESGQLLDSGEIFIATKESMIKIDEGVIIAKRHIHMTSYDATKFGVRDKEVVSIKALTDRPVIFEDVIVRVNDDYKLRMHIDFDEANAAGFKKGSYGKIVAYEER